MKVAIVGAGRVGRAVAAVARALPPVGGIETVLYDVRGTLPDVAPLDITSRDVSCLAAYDAVIAPLPPSRMRDVARIAATIGVPVVAPFESADAVTVARTMGVRHCAAMCSGVSPGLVGAAAMRHFDAGWKAVRMYAGALPARPTGRLSWMATWSAEGMVAQCLGTPLALRGGRPRALSPMRGLHAIEVGGRRLEAAWVAGGIGALVHLLAGRDVDLTYYMLRWPGHCDAMDFLISELRLREDPATLARLLERASSSDGADIFVALVTPEGEGELPVSLLDVRGPVTIGEERFSAVAALTAVALWIHAVALASGLTGGIGAIEETDVAKTASALRPRDPDAAELLDAVVAFAGKEVPGPGTA